MFIRSEFMRINRVFFCLLLVFCWVKTTQASLVTVSYTATIGFNSSSVIGTGGQNAGALIDELFGPGIGSSGHAVLTGTFTYDNNTSALNSNNRSAGYVNSITTARLNLAESVTNANISDIAQNASTSEFGYNTNPSSGFCADRAGCDAVGLAFTPTGNVVQVVNNSNFFILQDGRRVNFSNRDGVFFELGQTASNNEFSPKLSTSTFGDIFVDGVSLGFISNANRSLINSVALPTTDNFVTSDEVETTLFTIRFSGNNLISNSISLDGTINSFTTAVPIPSGFWLIGTGLLGLFKLDRQKKLKLKC